MKKTIYISIILLHCNTITYSQTNLVPNPSFEQYTQCPDVNSSITSAQYWLNPTAYSPDYFNACATSTGSGDGFSVPFNWYGNQFARTGNAYAGIIFSIPTNGREYIQTQLLETLMAGHKYSVGLYVTCSDGNNFATNNVGVYFSPSPISSSDALVLNYSPQIQNNAIVNNLSQQNTWIKIEDTLIASGNENYITIGNFFNDLNTDTTNLNNNANWISFSYYYIDDIYVIDLDSMTGISDKKKEDLKWYHDVQNNYIDFKLNEKIEEITVYDLLGNKLTKEIIGNNSHLFYIPSSFGNGVYLFNIKTAQVNWIQKIIINK